MKRVWGAVDDTPLPMDCRAYLKKECRMPLPPPPPLCPPAPTATPIPHAVLCPTLVAAQTFPGTSAQQLPPEADTDMTPCEPVVLPCPPVPVQALVPAPFIRPRYKTAIPLSRKILRRAFGTTAWERTEKLRLARMAEQGAFTFPTPFDPLAFDSFVAPVPVPLPVPATTTSQTAVLAKLASLGEFKAGDGVEFCGGTTFWEGEDGEEMEMEMEMCDEEFTSMFEDTEWGADEGDFEPIDEVDVTGEWEDEHEHRHRYACESQYAHHEYPEPVGAGEDVDLSVVFNEETEIVKSLGEIRSAAWLPPAMSRPRTRSGGRVGDLRRMEEEEIQESLQQVEDGEDLFRYRPLDESELEEWQATQSHELHTSVEAEEEFFEPDTRPKEEQETEQDVQIESPVEICLQSYYPRVVLKEIPASPLVDCFPSDTTASSLVQTLEEQVERRDIEQSQSLSPRPPVLLAPAPKHAWAFSSIKNALSSSVNSLVQIARCVRVSKYLSILRLIVFYQESECVPASMAPQSEFESYAIFGGDGPLARDTTCAKSSFPRARRERRRGVHYAYPFQPSGMGLVEPEFDTDRHTWLF